MLFLASLPIFPKFTITDVQTDKIVYVRDLNHTKDFHISFIHSVNKSPVEEHYKISSNVFILYKTVFKSYGAGMPELSEGAEFEIRNGEITLSNIDTELSEFSVFVGTIASHKIVFSDDEFFLSDISAPQKLLNFKIKKMSFIGLIMNNKGR